MFKTLRVLWITRVKFIANKNDLFYFVFIFYFFFLFIFFKYIRRSGEIFMLIVHIHLNRNKSTVVGQSLREW